MWWFDSTASAKIKIMNEIEEFDKWLHELIQQNGTTNYKIENYAITL